jgi:phosphoribosylformylglycinamidine cyclo-ligase
VRGLAHITGGGLVDNLPRVLPPGRRAFLKRNWDAPPVFKWLQTLGNIEQAEMDRVFNCGIGFAMIVSKYYADSIQSQLAEDRIKSWIIGEIRPGEAGVQWE